MLQKIEAVLRLLLLLSIIIAIGSGVALTNQMTVNEKMELKMQAEDRCLQLKIKCLGTDECFLTRENGKGAMEQIDASTLCQSLDR